MSYDTTYNKYNKTYNNCDEWVTLKEASNITGKSLNAIRMLVHRKKISQDSIKKANDNGRSYWMIHRDALNLIYNSSMSGDIYNSDILQPVTPVICQDSMSDICHDSIPVYYHDQKLKEWQQDRDNLMQGLLMYRYKFEELDRQVKMLPAPPEHVRSKIEELEKHLQEEARAKSLLAVEKAKTEEEKEELKNDYENFLSQLRTKLSEEERVKEKLKTELEKAMSNLKRPWWKKLFRIK